MSREALGASGGNGAAPRDRATADKVGPPEWLWVGLLLLAAGLAHGVNMFHFPYYESDEGTYVAQAWSIINQGKLSPYTYFYDHSPAGWIQIAAWVKLTGGFHTFGVSINSGRVLMLLMRVGVVLMLYLITRRLTASRVAATLACLLFAFSPYGIYFGRRIILDNIAAFWVVASLYLLTVGTLTLRRASLAGLFMGIAVLSKEPMVAVLPAFLCIAWVRCHRDQRVVLASAYLTVTVSTCSLYFLMAVLHGELFPTGTFLGGDDPHVSLIGSLLWHASRDKDGGVLQGGSKFWIMIARWLEVAWLLVVVGTACATVLAARIRKAPVAGAIGAGVLSLWVFFGRGGIIIYFYLVPLLPLLSLCVALGIAAFAEWVRESRWTARWPQSSWLRPAAAPVAAVLCLLALGREYTHGVLELGQHPVALWRDKQADSLVQATEWLLHNAPRNSRVVLDQSVWNELRQPRKARAGFTNLYYYWKVMYDPAVQEIVQEDWRTVDYLLVTPQLTSDANEDPRGGILRDIINRSTVVAFFDTAKWPVEVRRIDAPPAPEFAPATPDAPAPRGRVSTSRGTVLTDKGSFLRGATFQLDSADAPTSVPALSESHWKQVRELKLNVVRFDVKLSKALPHPVTLDRQLPKLDRAVELAARHGMYIMIMSSVEPGTYDKQELIRFWSAVAPRYKDLTHVIYEVVNEPVAWYPKHYTDKHLQDLQEVYRVIRRGAPDTHIVLWTFPNLDPGPETAKVLERAKDVFYTAESVGFHWYGATAVDVSYLQQQYPLFMTETSPGPPVTNDLAALQECERLGVSWVHLEGKVSDLGKLKRMIGKLNETGFTWPADSEIPNGAPLARSADLR